LRGDAHALWLDDVFKGLGLTSAALVGVSLGGWLALDYAARRPEAVKALALICPAGIGRTKNFLLKVLPLMLLGAWGKRKMREMVFGPARGPIPEALRPFTDLAGLIARSVRPRTRPVPVLSDEQLRGLKMPLLAIMGGRDVLIDMRQARERLERLVPQAEICFIEDGYHYLPGQAPRVMDFLERTSFSR
jgi:pimeloyl-ACP methyl ester carboxylesterase